MQFKTDMADERRDIYKKANNLENEINGIKCELEEKPEIKITRVQISNEEGKMALNKEIGNYVTIDIKKINNISDIQKEAIISAFSIELQNICKNFIKDGDDVLVFGLGNKNLVADALGSKVIDNIKVTRHINKFFPERFSGNSRSVSAISPGVMGLTGIETIEIVKGIVQNINPKLIIAIDSLASKNMERINKSIQISDTGIVPGSGVKNSQKGLNEANIGIPVIAVGVPTVIESSIIINDAINLFIDKLKKSNKSKYFDELKNQDNYEKIKESLNPKNLNLIVTPKEIDELVQEMASIISTGINNTL